MTWDPISDRVVLVGGAVGGSPDKQTWAWDGAVWTQLADANVFGAEIGLYNHALTTDVTRGRMVLIGTRGDVQEWNGTQWTIVDLAAVPEVQMTPRCMHAAALDPLRNEIVVFGGTKNDPLATLFGDTWIWNGTWRQETGSPSPSARRGASMVFDVARSEMVLFGGCPELGIGETWVWKSGGWTQRFPASSPPARCYHASVYDPVRKKVVVFGGSASTNSATLDDTWTWDGTTWTHEAPIVRPDPHTDDDGMIGAADPDCWSTLTPLCLPATTCDPTASRCGDSMCNVELETCGSCPLDCGACAAGCGNFACDGGETMASCPGDCDA